MEITIAYMDNNMVCYARLFENNISHYRKGIAMPHPLFFPRAQNILVPALITPFAAADHFKKDLSAAASVKISYIGDNFKIWFGGHVVFDRAGYRATSHILMRDSCDAGIRAVIGSREETDIAAVWHLMVHWPNGRNGIFFAKDHPNAFYCKDTKNVLRGVHIMSDGDGVSWSVYARSVNHKVPWPRGTLIFSRNS